MSDIETNETMATTVAAMQAGSKLKSNGIREVNKSSYVEAMGTQGVTEDMLKHFQNASSFVSTAASHIALQDLEEKIAGTSKDDLANEDIRRKLTATVRLPTFGGSTELTLSAEKVNPIPFRADADGGGEPQFSTTYGRLRTTINTKGHVNRDFHAESESRMRKALGIKDA